VEAVEEDEKRDGKPKDKRVLPNQQILLQHNHLLSQWCPKSKCLGDILQTKLLFLLWDKRQIHLLLLLWDKTQTHHLSFLLEVRFFQTHTFLLEVRLLPDLVQLHQANDHPSIDHHPVKEFMDTNHLPRIKPLLQWWMTLAVQYRLWCPTPMFQRSDHGQTSGPQYPWSTQRQSARSST